MKITLHKFRSLIKEALGKKVARVYMDQTGRVLSIDGKRFNLHEFAQLQFGSQDLMSIFDHDEDAYDQLIKDAEDDLLRSHNVTHIIDPESFGDDVEHPIEEYLSQ